MAKKEENEQKHGIAKSWNVKKNSTNNIPPINTRRRHTTLSVANY